MAEHGAPASYLTLQPGTPVHADGGEEVGTVEHVLADAGHDLFDGLVVSTSGGRRFADATLVRDIFERAVVLSVAAADFDRLPEPSANPATVSAQPDDTVPEGLGDKLRRAWDVVSGRY